MRNGLLLGWLVGSLVQTAVVGSAGLMLLSSCSNEETGKPASSIAQVTTPPRPPRGGEGAPSDPETLEIALLRNLAFKIGSHSYTPINIESYHLSYRFHVQEGRLEGIARVRFTAVANGYPYFFLSPALRSARLNGNSVSPTRIQDPQKVNTYTALKRSLTRDTGHEMEIRFEVPAADWSITSNGGVAFLTSFTDVTNWRFLNRYAPGNFESDRFPLLWELEIVDSDVRASHQLFANGQVTVLEKNRKWRVEFPPHYTSSGFYLHLSAESFTVKRFSYAGLTRMIPVTVYGKNSDTVREAVSQLPGLFAELERDYGPYAHPQFIANMNRSSGGMEYEGATITTIGALDHELLHSWFARGVKPAQGRSGWFDEAIASWRDYGYARTKPTLSRTPTNLSRYSIFQAGTPKNSYSDGRKLMAEFDMLFSDQGGYKALLKEFFAAHRHQIITTELYLNYIQSRTSLNLKPYFDRYVYGLAGTSGEEFRSLQARLLTDHSRMDAWVAPESESPGDGHPPALTLDEEQALR